MSRKINIIGKTNGAELSRDLALLAHALRGAGHDVCIATMDELQARHRRSMLPHWRAFADPWRKRSGRLAPADVNLMLAHVWPQYLRTARTNIVIPAPERFDRYDRHLLPRLDGVWAKTQHAHELFTTLNCNTTLLGFDGIDRHRPEIPRERTFLHLADESRNSGTDQLLRLWARHPHWPPLTVVQCRPEPDIRAHNIVHLIDLAADAALEVLQNSHLFHLCLSQTEGWSHPIVEALSVGAVTIAMDAPPMNELVGPEHGLLVPCIVSGSQQLATLYEFDERALQTTIQRAMALSPLECRYFGTKARTWFLRNKRGFPDRLAAALQQAGNSPPV